MSVHLPSRRVVTSASTTLSLVSTTCSRRGLLPLSQRRSSWSLPSFFGKRSSPNDAAGRNLDDPEVRKRIMENEQTAAPTLRDSIFEEEIKDATTEQQRTAEGKGGTAAVDAIKYTTDPDPRSRVRWERKKVIQMVRRQTASQEISDWDKRVERIAQTERQITHKSPRLNTSVKKLIFLAQQIQGKTLEDALLQMQYSKKKMAAEVKFQLEIARDRAIVTRGMGLGKVPDGEKATPIKIKTKDGETHRVYNPTTMYVSEAWVNRMKPRFKRVEFKGRGRTGMITSPATTISVVLKEEKTRIREHGDRVAKEAKRKPWVHLPNRPVTAQRPYYSW